MHRQSKHRVSRWGMWGVAACMILIMTACRDADDNPNDPGTPQPSRLATISGVVVDQVGAPLPDAALHVVYVIPATEFAPAQPAIPSQVIFNCTQVLTTECGGGTPLPDGIPVRIIWDRDADGPDETDEPPPICDEPPSCATGPMGTVNLNAFVINGAAMEGAPGTFYMEQAMTTALNMMNPSRFYLRIYCGDGGYFYTSDVINVPGGPSEFDVSFSCIPCDDPPEVPVWAFEQGYPNPATDSVAIAFGLEQAAAATITMVSMATQREFPLLASMLPPGSQIRRFDIRDKANGLYDLRMRAGGYTEHHTLLKNTAEITALRSTPALTVTNAQGQFTMQTVAEVSIERRGTEGQNQGTALLTRLRVIALKNGYQHQDTSFDVAGGGTYSINLRLSPL